MMQLEGHNGLINKYKTGLIQYNVYTELLVKDVKIDLVMNNDNIKYTRGIVLPNNTLDMIYVLMPIKCA